MDVLVVCEERLERTPDYLVWGPSSYRFWSRYLEVFDDVRIVARVRDVTHRTGQNTLATGPNVTVYPVPHYRGPFEYLKVSRQVSLAVRNRYKTGDAVIMRIGCHIAYPLYKVLRRCGAPYGVEVVGDPYEVFAPKVVAHPLRPLFRWWFTRQQRHYCAGASAAAYVTQRTLQQRYPCGAYAVGVSDVQIQPHPSSRKILSTHYSSVDLDERSFQAAGLRRRRLNGPCQLITVGSLEQLYKGTDFLLHAVAQCVGIGMDLTLTIVGDGKYRAMLETSANRLGIASRVVFTGALPGADAVKECLDKADLFVLPSLTEGLPRALIEAMARGLPCIASAVGGIPELLPPEDLVVPARAGALRAKISEVVADSERLERMSTRNALKALEFLEPILRKRRVEFYRHLRMETEEWARRHPFEGTAAHGDRGDSDGGNSSTP
jgi:glycosyltransferase involved in cell wall biosynthesis